MTDMASLLKALALGLCLALAIPAANAAGPKVFASPEEAAEALIEAVRSGVPGAGLAVIGEDAKGWILSGDPVQDKQDVERFIAAYDAQHEIEMETDDIAVLVVGEDRFPFAFPIVRTGDGWAFDAELGKDELLDRRIGRNELNTIQVLLAVADAQFEYASVDRDGDGQLEYAARLASSDGKRDGLYWPTEEDEPLSPLGPLVAEAVREGYSPKTEDSGDEDAGPPTYHGYHYKLLLRQGPDAPDGAIEYVVRGSPIGGFAVLAYPANYDNSGIMSFMISHEGTVYDADLGPETTARAEAIDSFNPGEGWTKVEIEAYTETDRADADEDQ